LFLREWWIAGGNLVVGFWKVVMSGFVWVGFVGAQAEVKLDREGAVGALIQVAEWVKRLGR
jgi:hypothetical protein